jgi:hypothetical protein
VTTARHAVWAVLLGPACFHPSYDHPACGPGNACPDGLTCNAQQICTGAGDPIDTAGDSGVRDTVIDGPASLFCDPTDPHLMVCYELDGDARDGSSHHLDATTANVVFAPGKVGEAMQFDVGSAAEVADSPVFDVAAVTIEAWIYPSQLPVVGTRSGIVDVNGQYALFLHPEGDLTCTLAGGPAVPTAKGYVVANQWTHVACTYDGGSAAIYVDGVAVASAVGGGVLATGGQTGMSIAADNPPGSGSPLIGSIDEVRLMDIARTPAQICADAGRASCP